MTVKGVHPRIAAVVDAQLESWRAALHAGADRVGWKIGLGIPEVEALAGSEPVIGHLTTTTLLEPGATFRSDGDAELFAETEMVVEVGPDLTVGGVAVGLELVDVARPPDDLEGIVAANVFHRAAVLGATRALPTGVRAATIAVNGDVRAQARAAADYTGTVHAVARLLAAAGERLQPGDRILAGSLTHVPVAAGDRVVAEIDGLGALEARIA